MFNIITPEKLFVSKTKRKGKILLTLKRKNCVTLTGFYSSVSILPTSGLYELLLLMMAVYSFAYHKAVENVSHSLVNHQAHAV